MINKELISIIVPIYNADKYLESCIKSILSQTYSQFELILVDDGSKDNSLQICKLYQRKDERILVIHQENAGVSIARNKGLSVMKGRYYCFVDSDDFIESEMIERLYYTLICNNADISICGFKCISKKDIKVFCHNTENIVGKENIANFVLEHYLEWMVSSPCGKLYRNMESSSVRFDSNISLGEDLKFNIQYFEYIEKIAIIEECLYCYMDTDGSLTKTYKEGHYEAICEIYEMTMRYITEICGDKSNINFTNLNYKLFSFCISFMSQNAIISSYKQQKVFIDRICNNVSLQSAICNLPKISFVRKMYVWGIKKKAINYLYIISILKQIICKYIHKS